MKNILVEFTDNGAIIHKDPSIIEEKKDLPYCFFNPDLSKVSGVSPAFWVYNEDKEIVPASGEEKKRREEYLKNKPPENKVSLEQILNKTQEDIKSNVDATIDQIIKSIDEMKIVVEERIDSLNQVDAQIQNTFDVRLISLKNEIDENIKEKTNALSLSITSLEEKDVALKSDIPSLDDIYSSLESFKHSQEVLEDAIKKERLDKEQTFVDIKQHIEFIKSENIQLINAKVSLLQDKLELAKSEIQAVLAKQEAHIKYLKIGIAISILLTTILKLF